MKRIIIIVFAVLVFLVFGIYILDKNYKSNANAIISSDYSQIFYEDRVYVPYLEWEEDHFIINYADESQFSYTIFEVIVENRFFLLDMFLTDYIHVSEDGKFIYLETDYDLNESNYYRLKK
ncbi:MAG: hypothetical protein FWH04_01195 [Oscillospiraceae bacterium]|nr:hypothetical protein [Oscillospiraceae bacterium]